MPRTEYKYLVATTLIDDLRRMLWPHVEMDPYSAVRPGHEYTVRSIYLDTGNLSFYHEKLQGLKERKKLRIRGYNEFAPAAQVFLEIKRKTGRAVTKYRSLLPYENLLPFLESGEVDKYVPVWPEREQDRENARRFLFHYHMQALRPTVSILYEREAFFFKFDHRLRITFDKNLRAKSTATFDCLFSEAQLRRAFPNHFILEVKTNSGIPFWLQVILNRLDLHQAALSKYVIGADSRNGGGYDAEELRLRSMPVLNSPNGSNGKFNH
jgi:hypothetical protein